jgi:hypothetical protein
MSVGRDPVDRVVDVLVAIPLCTAIVARDAIPVFARAGGRQIRRLAEQQLTSAEVPAPSTSARTPRPPDVGSAVANAEALPIEAYDLLAARQVCDRLGGLTSDELAVVERYERAHRGRRTVLGKIEQLRP